MTWTRNWPDGSKSVKDNESGGSDNMAYIEDTMQVDHYFDNSANKDGHHQFVQMDNQASDPSIAAGMTGVTYHKATAEGRNEKFFRNSNGIYQLTPSYKSGTVSITSTSNYVNVTTVPVNVYGDIYLFKDSNPTEIQYGFFVSNGTTVNAYSSVMPQEGGKLGSSDRPRFITLGNGTNAVGLNIRAKRFAGSSGTWKYRITYRDI